jgi:septum formation protein
MEKDPMAGKAKNAGLILASGSQSRKAMLQLAGITFDVFPAVLDEGRIEADFLRKKPDAGPSEVAVHLAQTKAESVSRAHSLDYVIAADQILSLGCELVHKSRDIDEARANLMKLRGRQHELHSAVALARSGVCLWKAVDTARMTMRNFSPEFLSCYLDRAGEAILSSVGVYHVEALGVQLFEKIEGDHFTILGLPLLMLLAELRTRGIIPV